MINESPALDAPAVAVATVALIGAAWATGDPSARTAVAALCVVMPGGPGLLEALHSRDVAEAKLAAVRAACDATQEAIP